MRLRGTKQSNSQIRDVDADAASQSAAPLAGKTVAMTGSVDTSEL